MLANLQIKPLGAGVFLLSIVSAYYCWQHITTQRDAYQAEDEHQKWQR